nr:hypothetical protein [Tanacetum cinerariifolium]
PGNEHQARQRFKTGQKLERAYRLYVAKPNGGEGGEREIHTVQQAAVEMPLQAAPVRVGDDQPVGKGEAPDLQGMGNHRAENA